MRGLAVIVLMLVVALHAVPAAATKANYNASVLADNPVGYWRFEETAGLVSDSSVNAFVTGTLGDPDLTVEGAFGDPGGAAGLMTDDRFLAADDPALDLSALTLEAWVFWDGTAGHNVIMNKESSYQIAVVSGTLQAAVQTTGPASWFWFGSGAITANQWTHVALTADATDFRLYTDGSLNFTQANGAGGTVKPSAQTFNIGARPTGLYFNGSLDEVAVYDGALSASSIAAHYNAAFLVPEPGSATLLATGLCLLALRRSRPAF